MLKYNFDRATAAEGKLKNKASLCSEYELNPDLPLFAFIGRFALEKGADLLPEIITRAIRENRGELNFMVLGSGSDTLAARFAELQKTFHVNLAIDLGYKEYLSHQIYASADFLLMPSRVEPCGLNQMYAMRYGTVPVVREVGGLKDTVKDIGAQGGYGIRFMHTNTDDPVNAIYRALKLYRDKAQLTAVRHRMMQLDFSWSNSAKKYLHLYRT
ncbi:MAG: glycosyltransferase, partial [Chryseobacterium sp.]